MIGEQVGRQIPATWKTDPECPFCRIIQGEDEAHKVYENDKVIAILGFCNSAQHYINMFTYHR